MAYSLYTSVEDTEKNAVFFRLVLYSIWFQLALGAELLPTGKRLNRRGDQCSRRHLHLNEDQLGIRVVHGIGGEGATLFLLYPIYN